MAKLMLVDASHEEETRVVLTDAQGRIDELDFVSSSRQQIKSNIYLAKITRVEPSLQAAFVEYGGGKQGFLSISEIHPDYYQIPIADREKLLEEEKRQQEEDEKREAAREEANEKRNARRNSRRKNDSDDEAESADSESTEDEATTDDKPKKGRKRTFAARAKAGEDLAVSEDVTEDDKTPKDSKKDKDEKPKKKTAAKSKKKPAAKETTAKKTDAKKADAEAENTSDNEDDADAVEEDVEVIDDDGELEDQRKSSHRGFTKRYKIQEVIKSGQIILVQVVKEERGNKGVSLSTYISIPGRYCVLMPNSSKGAASRAKSRTVMTENA